MIECAETVLPEPDSPTSATVSPSPISKEMWRTASTARSPVPNVTDKSSILRSRASVIEGLPGIERIAHRLADEHQKR